MSSIEKFSNGTQVVAKATSIAKASEAVGAAGVGMVGDTYQPTALAKAQAPVTPGFDQMFAVPATIIGAIGVAACVTLVVPMFWGVALGGASVAVYGAFFSGAFGVAFLFSGLKGLYERNHQ